MGSVERDVFWYHGNLAKNTFLLPMGCDGGGCFAGGLYCREFVSALGGVG